MYIHRLVEEKIKKILYNQKILILLGARQVGKTTLIKYLSQSLRTRLLNLDIEIDKERLQAVKKLSPTAVFQSLGSPKLLVIDEAQRLPEMMSVYKGWYDSGIFMKIVLLGSSSLDLLQQVESLTGRNEKIYLPPLLFSELLQHQQILMPEMKNSAEAILNDFIIFGGYPAAISAEDKTDYLLNLSSDYMLKDIFQLDLIKSTETMRKLLLHLALQIGSLVSINELAMKLAVSRQTVDRYLELLEKTYIIFQLSSYSRNLRREIVRSKKIYFFDMGLRNALLKNFNLGVHRNDLGQLWENFVIAEFMKQNMLSGFKNNYYFWRTRDGSEVDLILEKNGQIQPYELKLNATKIKKNHAFTTKYKVPVKLINKQIFLQNLVYQEI